MKQQLGDQVQFIVLSKPGAEHPESFSTDNGYTMTFGKDIDAFAGFGFKGIPATVFINADGQMVDKHSGALDQAQLAAAIEQIL